MATNEKLIIVDDARFARIMIKSYATKSRPDIDILEAGDGDEALRVIQGVASLNYATIDYNMPGMNGIELATQIRSLYPAARLALLTANVQMPLRRRAAELGLIFIDKPVTENKISAFLAVL
ncbi:Response regulator [Azospirillaceae bacterium]